MAEMWSSEKARGILERIVIEGDLVLQTPAHFGNGDSDELTDMPLLLDSRAEAEGRICPLLTGASIAGALRSYLNAAEHGYGVKPDRESLSALLFGVAKGEDEGEQSPLIVEDALCKNSPFGIELRDGVMLDAASRTAADKTKFDLQLWQAGTSFPLRFELCVRQHRDPNHAVTLKQALATALTGLNNGAITLGTRKRRGYGSVNVNNWRVKSYDLGNSNDLLAWLEHGSRKLVEQGVPTTPDPARALGVMAREVQSHHFHLLATFWLDGSLLIRSGGSQAGEPDMVHLHTRTVGSDAQPFPILSGTSLAGALRARAGKIANTITAGDSNRTKKLIDDLFGQTRQASRIRVKEHPVKEARTDLVQARVSIDRFTGGALDTALFNQQPAFAKENTTVKVELDLFAPSTAEVGLLLLLLKDLWTSDLPLGGESSVGRGRLLGKEAVLAHAEAGTIKQWSLRALDRTGAEVEVTGHAQAELEDYVRALWRELGQSDEEEAA